MEPFSSRNPLLFRWNMAIPLFKSQNAAFCSDLRKLSAICTIDHGTEIGWIQGSGCREKKLAMIPSFVEGERRSVQAKHSAGITMFL